MKLKTWKKVTAFLIAFAMIFGICEAFATKQNAYAAETVSFTVEASAKQLYRGDTVTYTVSMAQNETAAGLNLTFEYDDSVLELQEVKKGEVFDGASVSDLNDTKAGIISVTIASVNVMNNGTVFTATFKVTDTARGEVSTSVSELEPVDESFESVEYTTINNAAGVKVSVPATGVTVGKDTLTLEKGNTETITATVSPADSDTTVSWSSSDTSVATVSSDGTITAVGAGSAVITAKAGAYTATCKVTVVVPLEGIEISGTEDTIKKGQTTQLEVTYNPVDTTDSREVTWSSSDTSVAAVSESGAVTGLKEGTAVITASVGDKTDTYEITVYEIKMTGIELADTLELYRGKTDSLTVAYTPADTTDDTTVTWTSSDPSVAAVDEVTGEITGIKEGTAEITAATKTLDEETNEPFTATATVTVKENHLTEELAEELAFDETDAVLKGQTMNLYSILNLQDIIDENNLTDDISIEWTSSDEEVAVIDANGQIAFLKAGTVDVTANITAVDGEGNTAVYEVKTTLEVEEIPLESIAFDKIITEMKVGDTETLGIIYNPEDTTDDKTVTWSSSDSDVIAVDNGKITAKKAGTAVITAKAGDKSVSCRITVKDTENTDGSNTAGTTDGTNNGSDGAGGSAAAADTGAAADSATAAKTGDNTNVMFFVILLAGAAAVITVFAKKRFYKVKR